MTPGSDPQPQPERPAPPPLPPQNQPPQDPRPPRPPQQQRRPPQPPQRRPLPPRPPPRLRKQRHHGKASRARIGLVVIFVLLRMADAFLLLLVPFGQGIPESQGSMEGTIGYAAALIIVSAVPGGTPGLATPGIICSTLWTTALLVAIWRRQYWARAILVAMFGVAALIGMILMTMTPTNSPLFTSMMIREAVMLGCSAYLIFSRDMHRLTSRERS